MYDFEKADSERAIINEWINNNRAVMNRCYDLLAISWNASMSDKDVDKMFDIVFDRVEEEYETYIPVKITEIIYVRFMAGLV